MNREYKNTLFAFALSIMGIDMILLVINLLVVIGLSGLIDSPAWQWSITGLGTIIVWGTQWMVCASRGKKDVDIDALNQKRMAENPALHFKKQYAVWRGFAAGAIAKLPGFILLALQISLVENGLPNILLRFYFSAHLKAVEMWGVPPLAVFAFCILFSGVCGLAYMTGPAQRARLLAIIKRNEEKKKAKLKMQ